MKWIAYHNGQEIPYWLGVLIGFDQFAGSFWPGADIDKTISHRTGMKKLKIAIKRGVIDPETVNLSELSTYQRQVVDSIKIPFCKHPLQAAIDWALSKIDPGHCADSIGA